MFGHKISYFIIFLIVLTCGTGSRASADDKAPEWYPQFLGAQFTGIAQYMPEFRSPYSGPNSLMFDDGFRRGFSHTYGVYLGSRILSNLETYLDIEMARGHGVSKTTGVAGITNGDVIRAGTVDLDEGPYVARFYARYIHPLSGGTETVERGIDQLQGAVPLRKCS